MNQFEPNPTPLTCLKNLLFSYEASQKRSTEDALSSEDKAAAQWREARGYDARIAETKAAIKTLEAANPLKRVPRIGDRVLCLCGHCGVLKDLCGPYGYEARVELPSGVLSKHPFSELTVT